MTHVITFDTLAYANKLKNAGMEHKLAEAQAEVQAELLASLMDDQLATKQDIKDLRKEVHSEIKGIRLSLQIAGYFYQGSFQISVLLSWDLLSLQSLPCFLS